MHLPCHLHSTSPKEANTGCLLGPPLASPIFTESRWCSTSDLEGCLGSNRQGQKRYFSTVAVILARLCGREASHLPHDPGQRQKSKWDHLWCLIPFSAPKPSTSPSPSSFSYIQPLLGKNVKFTGIRCR